jgi:flagellar hook-associated protein 1 FlgK
VIYVECCHIRIAGVSKALATTSHNISNVGTEGYSRQRVTLSSREPEPAGNGFVGKGVNVTSVDRVYDQFLVDQLNNRTSSYNQLNAFHTMASQLDSALGDPSIGLTPAMEQFFNAIQDVANDPTSIPARQVMLSNAESLNEQFVHLDRQLSGLRQSVNTQMKNIVTEVNDLAASIGDLNQDIVVGIGSTGGQQPNDLMDQRDVLINKLAEYVNVNTVNNDDGSINVYIGTGQALVINNQAYTLAFTNNAYDPTQKEISLVTPGSTVNVTQQLSGGKIGGLLDVREEVIDAGQAALGRIAVALSNTFNTQHQLGDDLNGNPGGLFFNAVDASAPKSLPSSSNNPASGNISVTINNVSELKASDYRLNYDGSSSTFSLMRLSDNTVVDSGFNAGSLPRTIANEGITIDLSGTVAGGDSFLLVPTRYAASQMGLAISDPAEIAAAANGSPVGDNSNALALAALQTQGTMNGGTSSYLDAYSEMVADIGIQTHRAAVNGDAQKALLNQAIESREALSGVNLDEEAANLIKYQQAYQASAQVISVVDNMFQTLFNAVS